MAKLSPHAAAKRIALEVVGWTLVVAGIAALVLPGPGMLMLVGGLVVLSQQYEWAERRVEPVKVMAFKAAAQGVQTWPRILSSVAGAFGLMAFGAFYWSQPPVPEWWPLRDAWWLPGGWAVGLSLVVSALIALGFIVYSYVKFRGVTDPEAYAEEVARGDD